MRAQCAFSRVKASWSTPTNLVQDTCFSNNVCLDDRFRTVFLEAFGHPEVKPGKCTQRSCGSVNGPSWGTCKVASRDDFSEAHTGGSSLDETPGRENVSLRFQACMRAASLWRLRRLETGVPPLFMRVVLHEVN